MKRLQVLIPVLLSMSIVTAVYAFAEDEIRVKGHCKVLQKC